jgi:carbon storage regulator
MLVLSRKIGETIRVGSDMELVVLSVNRGRVKLGFSGSRDVSIRRSEHVEGSHLPVTAAAAGEPSPSECCTVADDLQSPPFAPLRAFRVASGV